MWGRSLGAYAPRSGLAQYHSAPPCLGLNRQCPRLGLHYQRISPTPDFAIALGDVVAEAFRILRESLVMTEMTPDDLDTVAKWHFAVGGLKTQSDLIELAAAVRLETVEDLQPLSEILKLFNDRFGTNFKPEDEEFLETLEQKLDQDQGLAVNTRENARLTFNHKVRDHVQDMIDSNFKFFKQINEKPEFADYLNNLLFDRYSERKMGPFDSDDV